jgi:hypothetical protein
MAAGIPFLQEMVVLFTVSALLAYVCYRLRLVPIVGFLVVLERLRLVQTPILDLAGIRDFETAVSDAQYLDRAIDRLEKRLANLREELALHQQDRTNRRLAANRRHLRDELRVHAGARVPLRLPSGHWIHGCAWTRDDRLVPIAGLVRLGG